MPSEFPIDFYDQHSSRKIKREVLRSPWGKLHSICFTSSKLTHRTSRLTSSSLHSPPNRDTPIKNVSRILKLQNNSDPRSGSDKVLLSKLLDAQDNPQSETNYTWKIMPATRRGFDKSSHHSSRVLFSTRTLSIWP
jgi:hypothetical protein